MEDFGYQKDEEEIAFARFARRMFLFAATLFSVACFIYVTVSAYYFVYEDENSRDIETIKSPEGPIKVSENGTDVGTAPMQIDHSIYEDIFGNNKDKQQNAKIRNAPQPAVPPKISAVIKEPTTSPATQTVQAKTNAAEAKPSANAKVEEKMVVYSDQEKQEKPTQDLLTGSDGRHRTTDVIKPKVVSKRKPVRVQVAAVTTEKAVQDSWERLNRLYPDLFSGTKAYTQQVDLGKRGIFFRLQVGDFYNQVEAENFCNSYVTQSKKSRSDCIVVE